eukprot:3033815-Alexandrium_andersonii.AAC.1
MGDWIVDADGNGDGAHQDQGDFAFEAEGGDADADANAVPAPGNPVDDFGLGSDYDVNLRRCVSIAGLLHIVSNLTKDMGASLVCFSDFVVELKQVCRLLTRRWSRTRFVTRCMSQPPFSSLQKPFLTFNAHVYEERWGE